MKNLEPTGLAVIAGHHHDPFSYLGPQLENETPVIRVFLPDARQVTVLGDSGHSSESTAGPQRRLVCRTCG